MTTHVEFLPNVVTFCELRAADVPAGDAVLLARDWAHALERIQLADCKACLFKLFMLGDQAKIALRARGMEPQAFDVDENALTDN